MMALDKWLGQVDFGTRSRIDVEAAGDAVDMAINLRHMVIKLEPRRRARVRCIEQFWTRKRERISGVVERRYKTSKDFETDHAVVCSTLHAGRIEFQYRHGLITDSQGS